MLRRVHSFTSTDTVSQFDFPNVFTDDYDAYCIEVFALGFSGSSTSALFRYIDHNGTVVTDSGAYKYARDLPKSYTNSFGHQANNSTTFGVLGECSNDGLVGTLWIFNPTESGGLTNWWNMTNGYHSSGCLVNYESGIYQNNKDITGFRIYPDASGSLVGIDIDIYGLRTS